ncbi:MAG: phosphosulfolactate synthase, partial [Bacteroidetes bacterium]|nr:phosphosulfolactate synthase [Bacteroidota bacterium]
MNAELFNLTQLPFRENKPRIEGLSMVMDKGLSLQEAENFIENGAAYADLLKLGFGTSFVTARLLEKVQLYHSAKIPVYLGGTLFEAYVARNQFNDYLRLIEKLQLTHVEV